MYMISFSDVGIAGYDPKFTLVGGINAPKKITCCGTDGVKRPQLIKVHFGFVYSKII